MSQKKIDSLVIVVCCFVIIVALVLLGTGEPVEGIG